MRAANVSNGRIPTGRGAAVLCAALLLAITAFRLSVHNPLEAVGSLYVIPISLAAMEFGWRGGAAAAIAALGLTILWVVLRDVPLGVIGFAARASAYGSVGLLVGLQSEQRRILLEDRQRLVDELRRAVMRDQLTGLGNRLAWDQRFAHELRRSGRTTRPLSLAVLDLDDLKRINDTHGHGVGDRLIQHCADAWSETVRETDFIARLGGDEFLVLLPDCPGSEAQDVALRMIAAVPSAHGVSIGIATWDGKETGEELTGRADRAMYTAKAAGGAQIASAADAPLLAAS